MFEKVLIVYSEKISSNHAEVIEKVKQIIGKKLKLIVKAGDLQSHLFQDIDLVVTIGGDGTFIRAASYLKNTPIIGINSESSTSEGALTSINESQLHELVQILDGKFKTIKRKRIQVIRNGIALDKLALNDVFVGSKNQFHTSRYIIEFNGRKEEQRSSGVLICSGSGSHAWYKSAGGESFGFDEDKMCFLVREPFWRRVFRPSIIQGCITKEQEILIESKMHENGAIGLDSDTVYAFNFGDICKIKISNTDLNVLYPIDNLK